MPKNIPYNEAEEAIYNKAFQASKAKTVKERMAEAAGALNSYRKGLKGTVDESLGEKIKGRRAQLDLAIEGKPKKKQ